MEEEDEGEEVGYSLEGKVAVASERWTAVEKRRQKLGSWGTAAMILEKKSS